MEDTTPIKKQVAIKKPKKTRSPYNCYSMEQHSEIKKSNPSISFGDIQKQISTTWKKLTDSDKESYVKQSLEDRKRYESEMDAYNSQPDEFKASNKKTKKAKYTGPKRTQSIYMLYKHDISKTIKKENP